MKKSSRQAQYVEAGAQYVQAGAQYMQAGAQCVEAGAQQYVEAGAQYVEAGVQYVQAGAQYVWAGAQEEAKDLPPKPPVGIVAPPPHPNHPVMLAQRQAQQDAGLETELGVKIVGPEAARPSVHTLFSHRLAASRAEPFSSPALITLHFAPPALPVPRLWTEPVNTDHWLNFDPRRTNGTNGTACGSLCLTCLRTVDHVQSLQLRSVGQTSGAPCHTSDGLCGPRLNAARSEDSLSIPRAAFLSCGTVLLEVIQRSPRDY
ncbi:hypothetical protein CYMTET_32023 [Cymbomonas tetramitiformis]|uniref:Uncharacterized protein n=1 Tax=Cymbomonas tetramitiformis TaxID=36881 RepID=A0AAE0FFZ1_9CHLO|nr:hypothetical protein CYMTET_32023 [Cymbomonas tetramitiformis]